MIDLSKPQITMIDLSIEKEKPKVSILMLTLDRYVMTKYVLEQALREVGQGITYELLMLDNGSKDQRVIKLIEEMATDKVFYGENRGISQGYNHLLKRAYGEYICFMPNDILPLSENWLADLISSNDDIEKSGLTSIHCEGEKGFYSPLLNTQDTFSSTWNPKGNITSGLSLINRHALEDVGAFDETLGIYGREREQYAYRLSMLGYKNYYVPGQFSTHLGRDMNDTTEYITNKESALELSSNRYITALAEMKKTNNYRL